ncbi:transcription termination factor NusA [Erysipelothrix sp. strain 2 (EsS2-6-Brazil)]|uniref:transcription termination factor NusA n=1 Tax=Erysipelothrix sp. strain 2 (EsS2-6-Brazil) TaxID=2500549 RepID=UPI00137820A9|nr:transcription termination factor NusA [Erysipelothrix sp. strain 2 (EsS2-6-Brazil)]MBK2403124.1 transcription termination/antitermination protein NusA [Erysipelothrix sp. strain 2 (EsS2-6-Brazil)]NBA00625.1 transcription termination/antitermination protein NusA [Erysipelothrix rhusiopathiae]
MNVKNVILAMQEIEDNRNISKEIIIDALQDSLIKAYRKQIGVPDALVDVIIDERTQEMKLFHKFLVVEEVMDDELEVGITELPEGAEGLQVGEYYMIEEPIVELGRAAATLAKNVIKQKIREAEKQAVYDEYIDQLGEMIMAMVESVEEKFVVLNLGKSLAVMPRAAQIEGETYREGQTLKVVITDVNRDTKGAQILVSRADAMLVRRLFENEVPEIFEGQVEIKAIAREAGERTKIAVYSHDSDIDPIGACIGPRGSRVQAIIEELKGEKIDIFEWSDNMVELINNALAPAEVIAVYPNADNKGLVVIVDDNQLSLAIGKRGKNARLAVRLTKQRIDIKSVSEAQAEGIDYVSLMAAYEAEIRSKQVRDEIVEEIEDRDEVVETVEVEESTDEVIQEVEQDVVEDVTEEETQPEEVEETIKIDRKDVFKPRTDYVSKFEQLADASRKEESDLRRRRRKPEREEEKPVNTSELLKEKEYEILPEYSPEELKQIEKQQAAESNSWLEEEIDFDEFDEYYDAE